MYRFIMLFLLLITCTPAFAATRKVVTQTPLYNQYYAPQAYYGGDYIPSRKFCRNNSVFYDINDLEKYAMNKNFTKDSDRTRLERLEALTFGAVQEGDIYARYDKVREAILSRPKQNYKSSVLRNISDYLNGQLTGFTPAITQTNYNDSLSYPYSSGYNKYSENKFISPQGNVYRTENYGFRNSNSIHIID